MTDENTHYETLFIVHPVHGGRNKDLCDRFRGVLEGQGATVTHFEEWGMRDLAYPIQKQNRGLYNLVQYQASSGTSDELERVMRLSDEVIRCMTVVLDDDVRSLARPEEAARPAETAQDAEPEQAAETAQAVETAQASASETAAEPVPAADPEPAAEPEPVAEPEPTADPEPAAVSVETAPEAPADSAPSEPAAPPQAAAEATENVQEESKE